LISAHLYHELSKDKLINKPMHLISQLFDTFERKEQDNLLSHKSAFLSLRTPLSKPSNHTEIQGCKTFECMMFGK